MTKLELTNSSNQTRPFMDFVKSHPVYSTIALTTMSAAAIYFFSSHYQSKPIVKSQKHQITSEQPQYSQQQTQIQQQLNHLKSKRQSLINTSKNFKVQYIEEEILANLLTEQCVLNILDCCIDLVDENELDKIYETSRNARRTLYPQILINAEIRASHRRQSFQSIKSRQQRDCFPLQMASPRNMNSIKSKLSKKSPISYPEALSFSETYYRFVCTFEQEFKYLIQKTQKDLAIFLNIDFSLITESIDFHISKDDNDYFKQKIDEWTSSIRQMLKNKLVKYSQPIDPPKIREILHHQISFLRQKREKLRETIKKLGISNQQQLDALPTLLATILQDQVYFKFQVEQQQTTVEMMHLSKNKDLEVLVKEFQMLTEKIVEEMFEEVNKETIQDDDIEEI